MGILFVEELGWDAQEEYLDTKAIPVFLSTMLVSLLADYLVQSSVHIVFSSGSWSRYINDHCLVIASRGNWSNQTFMTGIWLLWTLIWAIVGANLLALLMSVTTKELGGTQFSIYMTLINVGAFTRNTSLSKGVSIFSRGTTLTCFWLVLDSR